MKLHIKHIARIDASDIELDGITVNTGPNNTGKSMVEKVLWELFHAFHDLDDWGMQLRKKRLTAIDRGYLQRFAGRSSCVGSDAGF